MTEIKRLTDLLTKAKKIFLAKRWDARKAQAKESAAYTAYCSVRKHELNAPIKIMAKLQEYVENNQKYL